MTLLRRVWRHQRCNQNRISKNGHHNDEKKKWKRKNNDLQSIYIKRKVELTGVHITIGVNSGCYRKVCRSWSTSDTRRVNIVTNPIISREWVKDHEVLTISETYRLSLWHRYPLVVTQVMVVTVAFSKWWLHLYQKEPLISVASVLATSSDKEILIGATSSEISYHLRDIFALCKCCWNGATYTWKVHNGKIEIISCIVKSRS